jgi:uncharacterized protein YigE (DUF2233 family)
MKKEMKGLDSKRWILLFLTLTASPFLMGQSESPSPAPYWKKIDEGFEIKAMQLKDPSYQTHIKLQVLRIDLEKFPVRVMDSRAFGMGRMAIKELAKKSDALAGVNGGFFLPDFRPLGLLIIDGRETNPLRQTDWGIFLIQNNHPRIIHTREFQNAGTITQALQVGPRLVVSGRELRMKKQVARRSALGITYKDKIILLNSEDTEIYAQVLAGIFHRRESEGGLECRDALALDGGPSAQMYAEYKALKIDLPGGWPVPNGIGVFKRVP